MANKKLKSKLNTSYILVNQNGHSMTPHKTQNHRGKDLYQMRKKRQKKKVQKRKKEKETESTHTDVYF